MTRQPASLTYQIAEQMEHLEKTFASWDYYTHIDGSVTFEKLLWVYPGDGGERRCLGLADDCGGIGCGGCERCYAVMLDQQQRDIDTEASRQQYETLFLEWYPDGAK